MSEVNPFQPDADATHDSKGASSEEQAPEGVHRSQIDSPVGKIEAGNVDPNTPAVLIVQGALESSDNLLQPTYQDKFAEHGIDSMIVDSPRRGGVVSDKLTDDTALEAENLPIATLRKVESQIEAMDKSNHSSFDLVGHSEGAMIALIAALLRPDKVNSLTLVSPAGLIGQDSLLALTRRFIKNIARNAWLGNKYPDRAEGVVSPAGGVKYVSKNPFRALAEAAAVSQVQVDHLIPLVRSHGIKVGVIQHADDDVFPTERLQDHLMSEEDGVRKPQVDGVMVVAGPHNDTNFLPEKYFVAVNEMVTKLGEKSSQEDQ